MAVARVLDPCPQQQQPPRRMALPPCAHPGTGTVRRPCNGQKTGGERCSVKADAHSAQL